LNNRPKNKAIAHVAGDGTLFPGLKMLKQRAAVASNDATTTAGTKMLWTALHGTKV
jgi:hypothetical protein